MRVIKYLIGGYLITTFILFQPVYAVGLGDVPNAHHNAHHKLYPDQESIGQAIVNGKADLWLRTRFEDVDQSIPSSHPLANADKAELLSQRIALGYTTARWKGFYARVEGEAAFRIGDDEAFARLQ